MPEEFKTPNIDRYIKSLNKETVQSKKPMSFYKVFFAICICVTIIAFSFKGENLIGFLVKGGKLSGVDSVREGEYLCDEYEAEFANYLKPLENEEKYNNEYRVLALEKKDLDKQREEMVVEKNIVDKMPLGKDKDSALIELNKRLDQYNDNVEDFNNRFDSYQNRLIIYNEKVRIYKEYLDNNCKN